MVISLMEPPAVDDAASSKKRKKDPAEYYGEVFKLEYEDRVKDETVARSRNALRRFQTERGVKRNKRSFKIALDIGEEMWRKMRRANPEIPQPPEDRLFGPVKRHVMNSANLIGDVLAAEELYRLYPKDQIWNQERVYIKA